MLQREISRVRMNLPVIVVTAYEDHPKTLKAVIDGAKAVIAKPFRADELMVTLSRLVGPPAQRHLGPGSILPAGT